MFADPQLSTRLRPNLIAQPIDSRVASTMLDVGIDRQSLERVPGILLCPARYVESMSSLSDRAIDLELNEAFALWRQPTSSIQSRAALLYHRPVRQRLASFETARTPWRVLGDMQLVSQPLPQGTTVRQPYLEALAENDPSVLLDGGELLPLGQEILLRNVRSIISQLPTNAQVSEATKQPVIVRTYAEANRVTLVAMNMSPWHCDAQVTLDVSQSTTLEPFAPVATNDAAASKTLALSPGRQSWPLSLGPYEMRAVRIPLSGAKAVDVQADVPDSASAELGAKLADLTNRDLTAPRSLPGAPQSEL